MKKMVCEICGSQSIRKENGVFVCQDCGTEYSVEDAKKLLTEVDEPVASSPANAENVKPNVKVANSNESKFELIKELSLWIDSVASLNLSKYWFDIDFEPSSPLFWERMKGIDSFEPILPDQRDFTKIIRSDPRLYYFSRFYIGDLKGKSPADIYAASDLYKLYHNVIESNIDAQWSHVDAYGSVLKCGYTLRIHSEDESFNKLVHDMNQGSKPLFDQVLDLSRTGKRYYVSRITMTPGFFAPKNHDTKWTFSDIDVTKTFSSAAPFVDALKKYDNAILERYKNNFSEAKNKFSSLLNYINELENTFFVPIKYREPSKLYRILDIIVTGRADNWKEAINLFETDVYRDDVRYGISEIHNNLKRINSTLLAGFSIVSSQLSNINQNLTDISFGISQISDKVSNISRGVDYIAFDAFWRD